MAISLLVSRENQNEKCWSFSIQSTCLIIGVEARMCHNCMRDNMYNTLSIDQSIFLQLFLVPSCHCVTLVVHHLQCMRERSERLSCIWILQDFEKLLVGGGFFFSVSGLSFAIEICLRIC